MWDDFLSKIAAFCKNLVFLAERLDRQTTEIKEIRQEIKTLSSTAVDLQLEMVRLQSELRLMTERQEHAIEQANNRYELFRSQVALMLQQRPRADLDRESEPPQFPPQLLE